MHQRGHRADMKEEQKASQLEWGRQEGRVTGGDIRERGGGQASALVKTLAVILSEPLTRAVT